MFEHFPWLAQLLQRPGRRTVVIAEDVDKSVFMFNDVYEPAIPLYPRA